MDPFLLIVIAAIVGLVIGMLSGMLGIGGGTMMVPIFKVLFQMTALQSTATSLFAIIPTSISGAITHIRNKTCIPTIGITLGIGGAITSPFGVYLASISPEWSPMLAAACILIYSATTMFSKALKLSRKNKENVESTESITITESANSISNATDNNDSSIATSVKSTCVEISADSASVVPLIGKEYLTKRNVLICVAIGIITGFVSGYVGVGGGFLMVPMLLSLIKLPMKLTSGTSLIAVMILAIPGTITQAIYGNIVWIAGIAISIGAIPGAFVGSKLIKRIPEVTLRYIFGVFLLVAAAILTLEQLGVI